VLAGFVLLGQLAEVLTLPHAVLDLSPFSHVPRVPGGTLHAAPLIWMSLGAFALIAAGLVALRRRDLT
jgi:ABC-2 type transport system permease protein